MDDRNRRSTRKVQRLQSHLVEREKIEDIFDSDNESNYNTNIPKKIEKSKPPILQIQEDPESEKEY